MVKGAHGLYELRIHSGPGYRLYFGKRSKEVILLLCGGDKGSQSKDVEKAKIYWKAHKEKKDD
ncbi:MAG: type II toxin-antitoxin system RelE/ParE family toxin [Parachlamydiales bacterium]